MLWQAIKGICDIILYNLKNKQFFYAYIEILQDSIFIYLSEVGDVLTERIVKLKKTKTVGKHKTSSKLRKNLRLIVS